MFTDQNWRSRMQGTSAAIDDRFGEMIIIAPTISRPNYPPEALRTNPPYKIRAVFSNRAEQVFGHDPLHRTKGGAVVQSSKPIVSFSRLATKVAVAKGDVVTRVADGTQYEVTNVEQDGVSRTTLGIVLRGVRPA